MKKDTLPPCNIDAEQSILSSVLLDNNALIKSMELISPEDFYALSNRHIYQCMTDLFDSRVEIDVLTLSDQLKKNGLFDKIGGKEYIMSLLLIVPSSAAISQYCKIVKDLSIIRGLQRSAFKIIEDSNNAELTIEELIDSAESTIFKISQSGSKDTVKHISKIIDSGFAHIEELFERKKAIPGDTTGFTKLDDYIGGFQKSNLIVIAGRPGMGKTSFALNAAVNMAIEEKKPVLIFSLEMSDEELGIRMLCSEAKVDSKKIMSGYWSDTDWDKLTNAAGKICDTDILVDDSPNLNVIEIKSRSRKVMSQYKNLGLIVIDYLQLMRGTGNKDRHLEVAEISRSLKCLAKELDIPIVALSQLNRLVETRADKKPLLSDLRESGAIEQDSDIVMFVYRPEIYEKNNTDFENIAELIIAKNRSGPIGEFRLTFLKQFTRFENYADPQTMDYQSHF